MNTLMRAPPPLRHNRRPVPGAASFDRENGFVYVGSKDGVRKARARRGALLAPIDVDPELLRWPVSGVPVLVVTDDDLATFAARLAGVLVRDGATMVAVVSESGPLSFHREASTQ